MPEKKTIERVRQAKKQGKAATTQAGEFVREEVRHAKEGKHAVKSPKQAIAIGLSKARRTGVDLPPPPKRGTVKAKRPPSQTAAYRKGQAASHRKRGSSRSKKS